MLDTANCLLYNDYTPYIDVRCNTFLQKNFVFRRNSMKDEEKQLLSIGEIAKSLDITRRMILN